ncbi:hypothetical protein ACFT9I_11035 [Streptomyces sp. NPDC057137]|uniref:hypothetical protein n=1 Tax=Streptomyces sp. NPDC057137 TaxID=3346030 RepID=UPI00362C79A1
MRIGFGLVLGACAVPAIGGIGDVTLIIMIVVMGLGACAGFLFLMLAAYDRGFVGHHASWPGATLHQVMMPHEFNRDRSR